MPFEARHQLMTAGELEGTLAALAAGIHEADPDAVLVLLGIERRGAPLARRLALLLDGLGHEVRVGKLDINLYRDDLTRVAAQPIVRKTELPSSIDGQDVILVDDVIYTGRTVRAAMEALNDYGRVASLRLAVVVDRGGRELPIAATFVGRTVPAGANEIVEVRVEEVDGIDEVRMLGKSGP